MRTKSNFEAVLARRYLSALPTARTGGGHHYLAPPRDTASEPKDTNVITSEGHVSEQSISDTKSNVVIRVAPTPAPGVTQGVHGSDLKAIDRHYEFMKIMQRVHERERQLHSPTPTFTVTQGSFAAPVVSTIARFIRPAVALIVERGDETYLRSAPEWQHAEGDPHHEHDAAMEQCLLENQREHDFVDGMAGIFAELLFVLLALGTMWRSLCRLLSFAPYTLSALLRAAHLQRLATTLEATATALACVDDADRTSDSSKEYERKGKRGGGRTHNRSYISSTQPPLLAFFYANPLTRRIELPLPPEHPPATRSTSAPANIAQSPANQVHQVAVDELNVSLERALLWETMKRAGRRVNLSVESANVHSLRAALTLGCRALHYVGHGLPHALVLERAIDVNVPVGMQLGGGLRQSSGNGKDHSVNGSCSDADDRSGKCSRERVDAAAGGRRAAGLGEAHILPSGALRKLLVGVDTDVSAAGNSNKSSGSGSSLEFVFVAACHSQRCGEAFVAAGVPHVVCISEKARVADPIAHAFARALYLALLAGRTVHEAYMIGCAEVDASLAEEADDDEYEARGDISLAAIEDAEPTKHFSASDLFLLLPTSDTHQVPIFDDVEPGTPIDISQREPLFGAGGTLLCHRSHQ